MEILSARGELKATAADIFVLTTTTGVRRAALCGKWTTSVAFSRTAGGTGWNTFDTVVFDNCGSIRASASLRLFAPQDGWYLANFYLQSATATAHEACVQIHSSRLNGLIAYKKSTFPAGSASYPNAISVSGVAYLLKDDSLYTNWGASQAITSLTGEPNVGFGMWKLS